MHAPPLCSAHSAGSLRQSQGRPGAVTKLKASHCAAQPPLPKQFFRTLVVSRRRGLPLMALRHSFGRREVEGCNSAADQKVACPPDSADGRVGCAGNVRSVQVSRDMVQLGALQLQNRATVARPQRVVDNPTVVWVGPRPDLDQEARFWLRRCIRALSRTCR